MSGALRLEAPAKLNLSLSVVGRRDDGYHLLDSLLVLLELGDRLLLLPGCSGLRVEGDGSGELPLDASNLAWRGLVAGLGGDPDVACLALDKRIPASAGLGGGSSDAAAAWRLGRVWGGSPDLPDAAALAELAGIGADVPFFACGTVAARVTGIGERVEPVDPPSARHVVLVHPPVGLSTAVVFGELRPADWGSQQNDLLAPALRLWPQLGDLTDAVARAGGEPRMTGSGPTIFSITDDPERAAAVAARLERDGLRVMLTRIREAAASIERISEED